MPTGKHHSPGHRHFIVQDATPGILPPKDQKYTSETAR